MFNQTNFSHSLKKVTNLLSTQFDNERSFWILFWILKLITINVYVTTFKLNTHNIILPESSLLSSSLLMIDVKKQLFGLIENPTINALSVIDFILCIKFL